MHIVFITREYMPSQRSGGIGSYYKEIAPKIAQKGHKVTVICASDDTNKSDDYNEEDVRIIRLNRGDFVIPSVEKYTWPKKFRIFFRFLSYRYKLKKTLCQLNDIDIIETPEYGAEALFLLSSKNKLIIRLEGPTSIDRETQKKRKFKFSQIYENILYRIENNLLKKSIYITSCSNDLKEYISKELKIPENKIKTIYNPVDTEKWKVWDIDFLGTKTIKIFFAGTVSKLKGISDLIEACKILIEKKYNIELFIAGKIGSWGAKLIKNTEERKLFWCHFLGNLTRDELKEYYYTSTICCFPSWWEGLPLVCLESMVCGAITIGSLNGGMAEVIEDNIDGFLIQPQNIIQLSDKIEFVIKLSDEEKLLIKKNARKKVEKIFDTEVIVEQLIEFYNNIKKLNYEN